MGSIINTMAPSTAAKSLNAMAKIDAEENPACIALDTMRPKSATGILGYMSMEVSGADKLVLGLFSMHRESAVGVEFKV